MDTITQISEIDAIRTRDMFTGSKKPVSDYYDIITYYQNDNVVSDISLATRFDINVTELTIAPALLKIIDEIVVNAIDQYVKYPSEINKITIGIDKDGYITVANYGRGFCVEKVKNLDGVEMYSIQMAYTECHAGSNLAAEGAGYVGGQNGIGATITNVLSKEFVVETFDGKTHYKQKYYNGTDIRKPKIDSDGNKLFTKVTFLPDYEKYFSCSIASISNDYSTLYELVKMRAWYCAAFVGIPVYFCGKSIPVVCLSDYIRYTGHAYVSYKMRNTVHIGKDWQICLYASNGECRSIVNGIINRYGGTHISYLYGLIADALRDDINKELKAKVPSAPTFNRTALEKCISIAVSAYILNPTFDSQTKDRLTNNKKEFEACMTMIGDWQCVKDFVIPIVIASYMKKDIDALSKNNVVKGKISDIRMYREANKCVTKERTKCCLILNEGDSANGACNHALLSKDVENFSYDYYGTFSTGGVPINALKESITSAEADAGVVRRRPSKKVLANERISSLVRVIGLNYNKTYETQEEYNTLRYGSVLGLMDQDLDGFNIFGLLATYFLTFWPALVKRGFVKRLITPLIRIYPLAKYSKACKVKIFYSELEAEEWCNANDDYNKYYEKKLRYYKGLGSHDEKKKEVTQMFMNIGEKIRVYTLDEESIQQMYVYYGDTSSTRKVALRNPVDNSIRPKSSSRSLPLAVHFKTDTKDYQRDNIIRKLPNVIDGLREAQRKVLETALTCLGENELIKVAGLAGLTVNHADYEHSETSLETVIVHMAQALFRARNLPLFLPSGNFGSFAKGYKDFAASRYIFCMKNKYILNKLFIDADRYLLQYNKSGDKLIEPKYYVPIIPYALCENHDLPATGWTVLTYARDIKEIFAICRAAINDDDVNVNTMPGIMNMPLGFWRNGYDGRIVKAPDAKGKMQTYFLGDYYYDESTNQVIITELPPGIYSDDFIHNSRNGLLNKDGVVDVEDNTDENCIRIVITLVDGYIDIISAKGNEYMDGVIEYFNLKLAIHHRINMTDENSEVVTFEKYIDVFKYWFNVRKNLYIQRIARELVIVEAELLLYTQISKYISINDSLNIKGVSHEEFVAVLFTNQFFQLNDKLINSPKFINVDTFIEDVQNVDKGASYDYLMNLRQRDVTKSAHEKIKAKITALNAKQEELSNDPDGKITWLRELDELEKAITLGIQSQWRTTTIDYTFE